MRYNVLKIITIMSAMVMVMMVTLLMVACPKPEVEATPEPAKIGGGGGVPPEPEVGKEDEEADGKETPALAPSTPKTFAFRESDFNDGYISGTSAVLTLSKGSFKAASDTAWNAPIPTTGTALPIGLGPKAKRISPTKAEILFTGTATSHATANNAQGVKLNLKSLVKGSDATDIFVTFGFTFIDSAADPIKIYNARELQKVNEHPTLSFVLANDIDLTDVPWTPIGRTTPYSGTFDGDGKTIRNLKIGSKESSAGNHTGLFGKTDGATIKNLHIDHAGIWGGNYTGALLGSAEDTTITDVSMKSTGNAAVTGADNVGGLVGYASSSTVNGYATGAVSATGAGASVGGLVGAAGSGGITVMNGYATGDVSGNDYVGGLVGIANGTSTVNGYATGDVSATDDDEASVGGLVGAASSSSTVFGYATGDVSATGASVSVGGLVGYAYGRSTTKGYTRGAVERTGGTGKDYGLLVGYWPGGVDVTTGYHSATESEFSGITTAQATGVHGTAVDISKVTDKNYQATFPGFTFGSAVGKWTWVANGKWPAINLPTTVGGASAPKDQPTGPKPTK